MKKIEISKGLKTLVDSEMFEELNKIRWHASKDITGKIYVRRSRKPSLYLHQYIMGEIEKGLEIDHINGNSLDNRRENLRTCRTLF